MAGEQHGVAVPAVVQFPFWTLSKAASIMVSVILFMKKRHCCLRFNTGFERQTLSHHFRRFVMGGPITADWRFDFWTTTPERIPYPCFFSEWTP